MNKSTLTQLKIIVERAVRPVLASTSLKRKMREELLSHVSGVFEEESAKLGDERAALEQTALRFGNPVDVTGQLQESVPASDGIRRYCEARPGESMLRGASRLAMIGGGLCLFVLVCIRGSSWPSEPLDWGKRSHAMILAPLAGGMAAFCVFCAWILVQTAAERRRYHEEWARLPIEPCS